MTHSNGVGIVLKKEKIRKFMLRKQKQKLEEEEKEKQEVIQFKKSPRKYNIFQKKFIIILFN